MRYLLLLLTVFLSFSAYAQVDTCDVQITAVSDTPCSKRTLHLAVDSLPNTTYTWVGPGGWTASGDTVMRDSVLSIHTGYYIVTGTHGACTYKDTVNVFVRTTPPAPTVISLTDSICSGDTFYVQAAAGGIEYDQCFGGPNNFLHCDAYFDLTIPHVTTGMSGQYYTYVISAGRCISDTTYFNVHVDSCTLSVSDINPAQPFIPSLLQPGNPVFKPIFATIPSNFKMQVYDISGRKIFETGDVNGWNRTSYQGIYYYIVTAG